MLINRKKHKVRKFFSFILICILSALIILSIYVKTLKPKIDNVSYYDNLTVKMLNVGNSDCILILYKNDVIMIDTSTESDATHVKRELQNLKINTISHLILTHFHKDHIGGAAKIMSNFNVDSVYTTPDSLKCFKDRLSCAAYPKYLLSLIVNTHIPHSLNVNDRIYIGDDPNVYLEVLGPINDDATNVNNTSLVMKLIYGDFSMLLTGDAEYSEEFSLINSGVNLKANILKGAHHGYATSNSEEFIQSVSPDCVIFSTGADENGYAHFTQNSTVMQRFKKLNIPVYTTFLKGIVTITSNGKTYSILP